MVVVVRKFILSFSEFTRFNSIFWFKELPLELFHFPNSRNSSQLSFSSFIRHLLNLILEVIKKGCDEPPTAKRVVEYVIKRRTGSKYTLADNFAEARRIYFMAKEYQAMSNFMYYRYVRTQIQGYLDISY